MTELLPTRNPSRPLFFSNTTSTNNIAGTSLFSSSGSLQEQVRQHQQQTTIQAHQRFRSVARFGHSKRFSDLFSPDPEVTNDYLKGLLISALLLLSGFIVWGCLLLVFKCCAGPKRVGFLSGSPFVVHQTATTAKTTSNKKSIKTGDGNIDDKNGPDDGGVGIPEEAAAPAEEEAVPMMIVPNPWIKTGRWIFAGSCCCVIVFGITLATVGLGNMDHTTTSIGYGARLGYDYFNDAQSTLHQVIDVLELLIVLKSDLQKELKEFFFDLMVAKIVNEVFGNVEAAIQILNNGLEELGNFLDPLLRSINLTLKDGQQTCQDVHAITQTINLYGLQIGVGLVMTIIPLLLLLCLYWNARLRRQGGGSGSGGTNKSNDKTPPPTTTTTTTRTKVIECFRAWFLWPCFVTIVLLAMTICCGMIIAGMLNADFCSGGEDSTPDSTIIEIMDNLGVDPNSFEYNIVVYLVRDCDVTFLMGGHPLKDVQELEHQLNITLVDMANTIDSIVSAGIDLLEMETGHNTTDLMSHLLYFDVLLKELWVLLELFLNSLACRPLYDVYYTVTHRAACTDSYTGTFWIFLSLLLISFFGLLAITFRSALYPPIMADDLNLDWDLQLKEDVEVVVSEELDDDVLKLPSGGTSNNNMESDDGDDIREETKEFTASLKPEQPDEDCNDDKNIIKNKDSGCDDINEAETKERSPSSKPEQRNDDISNVDNDNVNGNHNTKDSGGGDDIINISIDETRDRSHSSKPRQPLDEGRNDDNDDNDDNNTDNPFLCCGVTDTLAATEEGDCQPSLGTSCGMIGVEAIEENVASPVKVVPLLKGSI